MPALSGRGPFSYDTITTGSNVYTLVKALHDPTNGETLEVLVDGDKIQGVGLSIAGTIISGDGFYVNSLTNPTTVSLVVASASEVTIRRISNRATSEVDFAPGSVIRESDLDDTTNQTLHVAQEAIDIALQGITFHAGGYWDAQQGSADKKIRGVLAASADNDAVNYGQFSPNIANIGVVAGIAGNVTTLATAPNPANMVILAASPLAANITKVANIDGNVTKVADIDGDVTKVADVDGEVALVSAVDGEIALLGTANMTHPTTGHLAYLGTTLMANTSNGYLKVLGNSTVTADMAILGSTTVTDDMAILGSTTVTDDMAILGESGVVPNIATVAGKETEIGRLGTSPMAASIALIGTAPMANSTDGDIKVVSGIAANVTKVADIDDKVTIVAGLGSSGADVTAVAGKATEIGRLGTALAVEDMGILGTADIVADMALLGTTDCVADMNLLATSAIADPSTGDLKLVADNSGNLTLVGDDLGGNYSNIFDGGLITDSSVTGSSGTSKISTVAGSIANVNTVGTNIANVNNFADLYQIDDFSPSAPTTDGGGNAVAEGDLAYDSTANELKFYNGSSFIAIAAGDISGVTAGTGLTGGGTSGTVTVNVIGGTGITANANDIAIDSTVATLSGAQTFTGTKTFTTPLLGTPTSGILTNCTALPAAQVAQGTMVSGMILVAPALGTVASGNIAACTSLPIVAGTTGTLTVARGGTGATASSTGSGGVVLATSPTLVTPDLGTPSSMMLDFGSI